jgi:hypothetical protein
MKNSQKYFVALSCLIFLSFKASAEEVNVSGMPDKQLKGPEVLEVIKGKDLNGTTINGDVQHSFEENNQIFSRNKGFSDSGTWSIEGDQLCIKFRKWEDSCRSVFVEKGKLKLEGSGHTYIQR